MAKIMTQVSVYMENRPGALAELTEALVEEGVNILAIAVPDTGEFGTVRVLPDDVEAAKEALRETGHPHTAVDVLVVDLPNRPGSLARAARLLADENVVIRYAFATIPNNDGENAMCIFRVDDIHRAKSVLDEKLN
jgi:hypothetical protein